MKTLKESLKRKKLVVFDLDGTLAETKSEMDKEMAALFCRLLSVKMAAVISGGGYEQFQKQLIKNLKCGGDSIKNLFIFPTTSTAFYRYQKNKWDCIYKQNLSLTEKKKIYGAFDKAFKEINYVKPKKIYGELIEDRGPQVSFSALGQDVVAVLGKKGVLLKKKWRDENTPLKLKLAKTVQKYLPNLEVRAAGYTTIDVTRKGIDKEYGIRQIKKRLHVPIKDMVFVGDALFPGGNDYAARKSGVECLAVSGPDETKKFIKFLLA